MGLILANLKIKRKMHLFTILEKLHYQAVKQYAKPPYGLISAPFAANMTKAADFIALCESAGLDLSDSHLDAHRYILFFDSGWQKAKALQACDTKINYVIYRGSSESLQNYADCQGIVILPKRPPALIFSLTPSEWQQQILDWQSKKDMMFDASQDLQQNPARHA